MSVLDNYKQITRIMTNSYLKSQEEKKRYINAVSKKPVSHEEDPDTA